MSKETAHTRAQQPKVRELTHALQHITTDVTHRDLVDNPIARILHIVDVRLEVGYTEQPCIIAGSQRPAPT